MFRVKNHSLHVDEIDVNWHPRSRYMKLIATKARSKHVKRPDVNMSNCNSMSCKVFLVLYIINSIMRRLSCFTMHFNPHWCWVPPPPPPPPPPPHHPTTPPPPPLYVAIYTDEIFMPIFHKHVNRDLELDQWDSTMLRLFDSSNTI